MILCLATLAPAYIAQYILKYTKKPKSHHDLEKDLVLWHYNARFPVEMIGPLKIDSAASPYMNYNGWL